MEEGDLDALTEAGLAKTPSGIMIPTSSRDYLGRLWSLWAIVNEADVKALAKRTADFVDLRQRFRDIESGAKPEAKLATEVNRFRAALLGAIDCADKIGSSDTVIRLQQLVHIVDKSPRAADAHQPSAGEWAGHAWAARTALTDELGARKFLFVERSLASYLDNDTLFGPEVVQQFPSASFDIKEAGNCIAAGCPTAAVMHLMRVLEKGLTALGRRYHVPVSKKQWQNIIESIEKEIKQRATGKSSKAKVKRLEFDTGAAVHFRYFKDAWRNYVMHGLARYDKKTALEIFEHVRALMNHLVENGLKEKRRTRI